MTGPQVIAHRGARRLAIENTLEALRLAWEEGADGVEFDVQRTADGELVLLHGGDLFTHTGSRRPVQRWTWRELRAVRLRNVRGQSARVPHLDEAIEALQEHGGLVNAELKLSDEGGEARELGADFAHRTRGLSLRGWVVSAFSSGVLSAYVEAGGPMPLAALFSGERGTHRGLAGPAQARIEGEIAAAAGAIGRGLDAVHPAHGLVEDGALAAWRGAELDVRPWTVNTPARWYELLRLGVDGIITDDPGGLRSFIGDELG